MAALADQDRVERLLGRGLTDAETARVLGVLEAASARFRVECGRDLSLAERVTVLRMDDRGCVSLPERPVSEVSEVRAVASDGTAGEVIVGWVFDGVGQVTIGDWWSLVVNAPAVAEESVTSTVQVTYTAGYQPIPEDVAWAVAAMAVRSLTAAQAGTGIESETIGAYSYRMGGAAAAGVLGMTAEERMVARRYRRRSVGSVGLR